MLELLVANEAPHPALADPASAAVERVPRSPERRAWWLVAGVALLVAIVGWFVAVRVARAAAEQAERELRERLASRARRYTEQLCGAAEVLFDPTGDVDALRAIVDAWPDPVGVEPELRGWEWELVRAATRADPEPRTAAVRRVELPAASTTPFVRWDRASSRVVVGERGGRVWSVDRRTGAFAAAVAQSVEQADRELRVRDGDTGEVVLRVVASRHRAIDWSRCPVDDRLAVVCDRTLRIHRPGVGATHPDGVAVTAGAPTLAWSGDGAFIARAVFGTPTDAVTIHDGVTGRELGTLAIADRELVAIAWSRDTEHLAVASRRSGVIHVVERRSGATVARLTGEPASIRTLDWHPDGSRLVGVGVGGLAIWEVARAAVVFAVRDRDGVAAWSSDGQTLAALSSRGTLWLGCATPGNW